jgi:hypothetical protein
MLNRHCERSEAIQGGLRKPLDCFVAPFGAPRNDAVDAFRPGNALGAAQFRVFRSIQNAAKQLFLLKDSFLIFKNCAPKWLWAAPPQQKALQIQCLATVLDKAAPRNKSRRRFAHQGASTGDSRLVERVRFLRAGLVTPLPGGPGIDPLDITVGAPGAWLRRER